MNSRDDDLTLENVDERIEQLTRTQSEQVDAFQPPVRIVREVQSVYDAGAQTSLTRTVSDLQRVYDEDRRLEHAWERINFRTSSLESTMRPDTIEKSTEKQSFQGEQKTMKDTSFTRPGSFEDRPTGPAHPPHRWNWRNLGLSLAAALVLIAIFAWSLTAVYHGTQIGSDATPVVPTPTGPAPVLTPTMPAGSTAVPTPTARSAQLTPTATVSLSDWQTYHGLFFTIQYPANWSATIIQPGPNGGIYMQQVEFRPSANSSLSFVVSSLYNGEMSPDTLLQNDTLYKSCKVDSQSKETVNGFLWSTAIIETQGTQLAPAKIKLAYANHKHPYRIDFSTPPTQFSANYGTLNTMFQSFKEE